MIKSTKCETTIKKKSRSLMYMQVILIDNFIGKSSEIVKMQNEILVKLKYFNLNTCVSLFLCMYIL